MDYRQEDTMKMMTGMRTAARRTSNPNIANALNNACERMAEMESFIFQLTGEKNELIRDNALLTEQINDLEKKLADAETRQTADGFDYHGFVRDFYQSGEPFRKILLERKLTRNGNPWYVPKLTLVRRSIETLGLPIEVQQRTSSKDDSIVPTMILYRTDD